MAERTTAEDIAMALGAALVRKGVLDVDDLARAAAEAETPDVAHALRTIAVEGQLPPRSDWEAGHRRSQMRLVKD